MAKAKKLPSGSWRTQVYSHTENGKKIYESFTADTKAESEYMAAQFIRDKGAAVVQRKKAGKGDLTVRECIDKYIALKGLLSPSTLEGYEKVKRTSFASIMDEKIKSLSDEKMQIAINDECKRISRRGTPMSPKTVINNYSLIATAIKKIHGAEFNVTLPRHAAQIVTLPSVPVVMSALRGLEIELPCLIALWLSFSMSEIRGLKCSSVRDGKIFIDQVVISVKGEDIEKAVPKAEKRTRAHSIPQYIMELIETQDTYKAYKETGEDRYLIALNADQIRLRFQRLMEKHGIKDMTFHRLRHMNASVMALLDIPEKYAMERGGWKTPHTMQRVYQHTFTEERQAVDVKIDAFFESMMKDIT